MTVTFPAWWAGGYPDREFVVKDLLTPFLELLTPVGTAVSWLPKDYGELLPIVRIYRGGGAVEYEDHFDSAAVQVGVIAETRADSWAVLEYCRQILLAFSGGTVTHEDGSKTVLTRVTEMMGPQQIPELNPDFRLVQATFAVECRRGRGVPEYARIVRSL